MRDSNERSIVKAVSYRIVATTGTILISLLVTGKVMTAISIGFTEVFSKIIIYFVHERVWNAVRWGRVESGPKRRRSIVKSISYRITGTITTMVLAYIFSGNIIMSLSIGGLEVFTKIVLYYFHERAWSLVKWGRLSNS